MTVPRVAYYCEACMTTHGVERDCPMLRAHSHAPPVSLAPITADEDNHELGYRYLRERTFNFALLGFIKRSGLKIPSELVALSPDPIDD